MCIPHIVNQKFWWQNYSKILLILKGEGIIDILVLCIAYENTHMHTLWKQLVLVSNKILNSFAQSSHWSAVRPAADRSLILVLQFSIVIDCI